MKKKVIDILEIVFYLGSIVLLCISIFVMHVQGNMILDYQEEIKNRQKKDDVMAETIGRYSAIIDELEKQLEQQPK